MGDSETLGSILLGEVMVDTRRRFDSPWITLDTESHNQESLPSMRSGTFWAWRVCVVVGLLSGCLSGMAFSLLGPWAEWMDVPKGYRNGGDIGGPMNIGEGYRWNVPVVTYGFDQSFRDYFGSNGVAAVEQAIAILNALPPASSTVLTNYPLECVRMNYRAQQARLIDLKSVALQLLLEQMGLADPLSYTFCIRDYRISPYGTNYTFQVAQRSFDPVTAEPSAYLNGVIYSYVIMQLAGVPSPTNLFCWAYSYPVDPLAVEHRPATSRLTLQEGCYLTGLTRDDVGGLRYLLSGNNVCCESLLPDVHSAGTNNSAFVRTAYRPGIEKLQFVRHPYGSLNGEFKPYTNRWTDVYYDWDEPVYQEVERITTRADIVFSGQDLGEILGTRTGTTNWVNNAELNDNPDGAGPGQIQPPIKLSFNTGGPIWHNTYNSSWISAGLGQNTATGYYYWGTFDFTTNAPLRYPNIIIAFQPTQVRFRLLANGATNDFAWALSGGAYAKFLFQTSTNPGSWSTLATLTNSGADFAFTYPAATNDALRLFRTIQQP